MELNFVIAQLLAVIGWFFLIYSYYKEDIHQLLKMQIIACTFETLSYMALGAWSGLFACLLDLIKAALYYKTDKKSVVFFATLPFYIVLAVFAIQSEGPIALLPAIGGVIDGFVLTRSKTTATIGSIVASILWIIYDLIVYAYAAAIADVILVTSNFFVLFLGYSRILHIEKLHVIKCQYLTRNLSINILNLDKKNYPAEYLWSIDQQRNIFKLNPDSILLIRNKKRIIGYLNYLTITEEAYKHIKRAQVFYRNVSPESITAMRRHRKNYLLIESICIDKSYDSDKMVSFISRHFRTFLRNRHKQGCNFYGIASVAISDFEKEYLEAEHFAHIKDYRNGEALYELDDIAIAKYIKPTKG
jgi:hypothetical protein